jgi:hypothetical protein
MILFSFSLPNSLQTDPFYYEQEDRSWRAAAKTRLARASKSKECLDFGRSRPWKTNTMDSDVVDFKAFLFGSKAMSLRGETKLLP